ncbi:ATP-binding protein [Pseudomonas oryzae]|uniref:Histidine kinase-, DNA gyrase B-, and HSP90-like ATPase n=1 Tax=Pseudomonas oryzae TaxID=1392877 RepID=A0A1H1N0W2_9PSED|nr:ATP-binding protein [Pseudomonas oryzae]SDR92626.1 hypothetical protein SAMN05216221_0672 [Pseudomonas oryzae]
MAISPIPVDQRVIDIDSRRFASVEKALVELITNADDSYGRLEQAGATVSGRISIRYERHQAGAVLAVADQAEGMAFDQARFILAYGGAHSPLARGEGGGRGYFGRGLKQAIYGLGYGWIETIRGGRYSRIELFRDENGGYLYDDGDCDRPARDKDHERLEAPGNGTRVSIVTDHPQITIPHFRSLVQAVANNIYLRDVLRRRTVELVHMQHGKAVEHSGPVRYQEPAASVLIGPDQPGQFVHDGVSHPFTLTLKRALDAELTTRGDERSNGLLVLSGTAVLDCQLFDYENQVGTEYLFGTVECPALLDRLGQGLAVISDEREGLNQKEPFVAAFASAVSALIAPCVLAERDKLKHLEHATASGRTSHMIERLLERMSRAAIQDFGLSLPPVAGTSAAERPAALRFSTPFYYRQPGHPFHVTLLIDPTQLAAGEVLRFDYRLPDSLHIEPDPVEIPVGELGGRESLEWTVSGDAPASRGEILVRAGTYWAWCELVVAEQAAARHSHGTAAHAARQRAPRDHGERMFVGYEFRSLHNELDRAVYSPAERKILINTAAPTVQLYVDGRGHFRDTARLLLAELFMDVISDELARRTVERLGKADDATALHKAKLDIIRRYGSEIHQSFLSG